MDKKKLDFRNLTKDEIECKATPSGNNNIDIILHLRAETCTKILNEVVGPMNWEKTYTNGNKNCIVSIWDEDKNRMISKEDCGGSVTDVEGLKGQASNGFKRACALGWGLGIELYTQPKILIPMTDDNAVVMGNKVVISEEYFVSEIEYDNKRITSCTIVDSNGDIVYPPEKVTKVYNKMEIPSEVLDEEIPDELPDNTDGYEDEEALDYEALIQSEIKRTHVKTDDVLKVLKIDSFDRICEVPEKLLMETLNKLKMRETYIGKA